ncbi:protein arv1 isoform X2 [Tripterygium wilfordii]|uniref:Protein ARV n=1 Tax=Tripterygium wilfordii TaxID=458696 RepID=A0A7J7CH72_TRIWF|nr:protein arv1 isoform X2 [Tripterygium wilfordii]
MEYRCVQCGFGIQTLYVQYSPGNIRLMKCGNCKAVADEYIECEIMGLLWKLSVGFLLLDAYRSLLLRRSGEERGSSISFSSLVWTCQRILPRLEKSKSLVISPCYYHQNLNSNQLGVGNTKP